MNVTSIVKKGYHRVLPFTVRDQFWRLREGAQQKLRSFPTESQKKLGHFRRYLNFRLKGQCNACGGKQLARYHNPRVDLLPYSFYRCLDCAFIFVAPLPDIPAQYEEQTMPDFGEGEGVWNAHYLESIERHAARKGRILEIGFGNASFLKLAHEGGWEVYGAELSVVLAAHARERLGLPNIALGKIEEISYPDNFFDVVAGFNFLEHVPDPRATLHEIRRILRPSGLIALMCPNIAGIYHLLVQEILAENDPLKISWIPPDHVSYFNKTNLKILMEDVGFSVEADDSHLMNSLWRQHEVNIGPRVTGEKLAQLRAEIRSSSLPKGEARVLEYRERLRALLSERMAWAMISDLIELDPELGAESAIFFVGRKV
ncbi:MAG TPA: class I SAM-dependent methyltransferase [Pyrinomonadaceae bacterium]|jgi:SAM-dependent methyltransferase